MIVYATFDGQGFPTGFYPDAFYPAAGDGSVNLAIPAGAVAITEAQWADCLAHQGARQWVNGTLQPYAPPPPPPPPRTVAFTTLVDALSSSQYAAIDPRDRDRMQSENGGVVSFSSSKVGRAAKALSMTPDDLFKLAGA